MHVVVAPFAPETNFRQKCTFVGNSSYLGYYLVLFSPFHYEIGDVIIRERDTHNNAFRDFKPSFAIHPPL